MHLNIFDLWSWYTGFLHNVQKGPVEWLKMPECALHRAKKTSKFLTES
ncbi:MAG: hypothetical protein GQF41_0611 [Candidatus Rifleibacterium amylolyticum]|nr:MAG: hypothetical protein GQF41_0611 [Candidatus Rifleibacterium amylolyticum]